MSGTGPPAPTDFHPPPSDRGDSELSHGRRRTHRRHPRLRGVQAAQLPDQQVASEQPRPDRDAASTASGAAATRPTRRPAEAPSLSQVAKCRRAQRKAEAGQAPPAAARAARPRVAGEGPARHRRCPISGDVEEFEAALEAGAAEADRPESRRRPRGRAPARDRGRRRRRGTAHDRREERKAARRGAAEAKERERKARASAERRAPKEEKAENASAAGVMTFFSSVIERAAQGAVAGPRDAGPGLGRDAALRRRRRRLPGRRSTRSSAASSTT